MSGDHNMYCSANDKQEPVAWMNRLGRLEYEQGNGFEIPLYTHPVKELTNMEIMDIGDKYLISSFIPAEALEFAKAILKKARGE